MFWGHQLGVDNKVSTSTHSDNKYKNTLTKCNFGARAYSAREYSLLGSALHTNVHCAFGGFLLQRQPQAPISQGKVGNSKLVRNLASSRNGPERDFSEQIRRTTTPASQTAKEMSRMPWQAQFRIDQQTGTH